MLLSYLSFRFAMQGTPPYSSSFLDARFPLQLLVLLLLFFALNFSFSLSLSLLVLSLSLF